MSTLRMFIVGYCIADHRQNSTEDIIQGAHRREARLNNLRTASIFEKKLKHVFADLNWDILRRVFMFGVFQGGELVRHPHELGCNIFIYCRFGKSAKFRK